MRIDDEFAQLVTWLGERQPAQSVNETDPLHIDMLATSGLQHDLPNEVVDQSEHREFLEHTLHRLALQNIHLHRDLDVAEIRLDSPPLTIEFSHGFEGVDFGVQQCRDERDVLGAKSLFGDVEPQFAKYERIRQRGKLNRIEPCRARGRLVPLDDLVRRA